MIKHLLGLATLCLTLATSPLANAYFSTIDTGELVAPHAYRATLEPQFILNKIDGANGIGRFSTGITEESSAELVLGLGEVDFQAGAFYKLIPYPDTEGQPAIGAKFGFLVAEVGNETEYNLRFHPLVSKTFETEAGALTPYGSIPLGLRVRNDTTTFPLQVAGGVEYKVSGHENLRLMTELGLNLSKAFDYISFAVAYNFDEENVNELRERTSTND